jgi:hypothetical protein
MSARVLGATCVGVSAAVFVYFTLWTFAAPFAPASLPAFPPRALLLALPYAGAAGLCLLVAAFIRVTSARARAEKERGGAREPAARGKAV